MAKKMTFSTVRNCFKNKINAYQTLYAQTSSGSHKQGPTPAQLNTFGRWIEKGAQLQKVTPTQLNRWAGTSRRNWTPNSAKNCLASKWGKSCIKAVTNNKTGGFLVATSSTRKGKPFRFSSY